MGESPAGDLPSPWAGGWTHMFGVNLGGKQETPSVGQTTSIQAHKSPPFLPPSQLLKAVVEVTDTSVKAVRMAKQQQGKQICWGSNNSVMSLGMWSPLLCGCGHPSGGQGQGLHGAPPLSACLLLCLTRIWGLAPHFSSSFSNA